MNELPLFVGATVGAIAAGSLASVGSTTSAHAAEDDLERWALKEGRPMSVRVTALGAIYYPADLSAGVPAPLIVWDEKPEHANLVYPYRPSHRAE